MHLLIVDLWHYTWEAVFSYGNKIPPLFPYYISFYILYIEAFYVHLFSLNLSISLSLSLSPLSLYLYIFVWLCALCFTRLFVLFARRSIEEYSCHSSMEARNGFEREGRCIKEEGGMGYAWLPVCHKQRPIFCFRLAVAGGVRGAKHTLSFSICVYACVWSFFC